jgi:signal peptide peptidase SppA
MNANLRPQPRSGASAHEKGDRIELKSAHWKTACIDPKAFGSWFFGGYYPNELLEGGISVVSVCGPLEHHEGWFDSYDSIVRRVQEALDDPESTCVVMRFDSPGGDASGVEEAHRTIKDLAAASGKTLYAYSNEACYSAAYWLACSASEIYVPTTGGVGSVGVIAEAIDTTEMNKKSGVRVELVTTGARKADGHPDRPLTEEILSVIQARVDQIGEIFFASVADSRAMKPAEIAKLQAGTFLGKEAIASGLADGVFGWDEFIDALRSETSGVDAPNADPVRMGGKSPTGSKTTKTLRRPTTMKAKTLLALTQAVTKAEAAVESAKTPEERKAALAALKAASAAEAKMKYSKRTRTDELEEDDGEAEDEESEEESEQESEEEEDDEPPSSSKPGKKPDDSDDDDDASAEEDDDAEEDDEKSKSKAIAALSKKGTAAKIYGAIVALTGTKNLSEAIGAMAGIKSRLANASKLEARVGKLESTTRADKVNGILATAAREGKITRASMASLRTQGMKDPKWLKGYLASLPKKLHTVDDPTLPKQNADGSAAVPSLDLSAMSKEEREMYEISARAAGLSLEKYMEEAKKTAALMSQSAPKH